MLFATIFVLCSTFATINSGLLRSFRYCRYPSTCVDIFKCPTYHPLLPTSGNRISKTVLRQIKNNFCGATYRSPQVCCVLPKARTTTTTEKSYFEETESEELTLLQASAPEPRVDVTTHRNFKLLPISSCGDITNSFRITNGKYVQPGEFPWMSLIAYKTGPDETEDFKCAGSLINNKYVLTAAHCIDDLSILGVRLGEHDLTTERDDCNPKTGSDCAPPVQDILISKVVIHPRYDPSTYVNDIALIRLATPANLSEESVRPICLPFGNLQYLDLTDKRMTVAGWGVTEDGESSTILRKAWIPLMSLENCRQVYRDLKPISSRQLCAGGYKGRDSCGGDSGGPLMFTDIVGRDTKYVQYGIVSYGPRLCGTEGRPGIYTSVKEYMAWILDNLAP